MNKPPLDFHAPAKLYVGPDFEAQGESLGRPRDVELFPSSMEALRRYEQLGARKYGAIVETSDGKYLQDEIEAALRRLDGNSD